MMLPQIEKLRDMLNREEDSRAGAAVAVLLNSAGNELRVLLVKRAINPSDPWSGDIAFPGGKKHADDGTLKDTVVRETTEETGIDLLRHEFLGTMEIMNSNVRPEMFILPFVVVCDEAPEVTLDDELCAYFWAPIEQLKQSRCKAKARQWEVSAFLIYGEVVWGLTYGMLENLIAMLDKTV